MILSDTTDVQDVIAVSAGNNSLTVQCVFVTGSTARGCMVVLVGQSHNIIVNLARYGLCAISVGLSQATCITEVIGYDIESDGTVGTLAIKGVLLSNSTLSCLPVNDTQSIGEHTLQYSAYMTLCMYLSQSYYRLWHSHWNSCGCGSNNIHLSIAGGPMLLKSPT